MRSVANSEEVLCQHIADYMRLQHPNVLFHFDYGSGLKMTMGQAVRQKRLNRRSWPDMFIAYTVWYGHPGSGYGGLFLELKREGTRLKKRDDTWASDHIAEQAEMLDELAEAGYIAQFAVGFDQAVELIESYVGNGWMEAA